MMNYDLFKKVIKERIMEYLPPIFSEAEVSIEKINKINEEKESLIIMLKGDNMVYAAPSIYLDDMYEEFSEHEDLDDILFKISLTIMQYTGFVPREMIEIDFSSKKDNIVMTLINKEKNKELLENMPHKEILDLAIMYRIVMSFDETGFNTVMLTNELMEDMGMTVEELNELAKKNTCRIFPLEICKFSKEFYMMTNEAKVHGATTMVCPEAMQKLAEIIDDDFYIIPSSIHEILAVPSKYAEPRRLIHILEEGNKQKIGTSRFLAGDDLSVTDFVGDSSPGQQSG